MIDRLHTVAATREGPQRESIHELWRALFVPGYRYGWFARDLASEIRPYQEPPPPDIDAELQGEYQSLRAAVAADDERRGSARASLWLLIAPVVIGVGWYFAYRGSAHHPYPPGKTLAQIIPVIVGLELLVILGHLAFARGGRQRRQEELQQRRREELQQRETYLRETPKLQRRWRRDREAWDDAERARVLSQPQHVPRGPGRPPRRGDIVGGDLFGWQCLLTTLGSSLLAGGARVEVLDLTERGTAAMLTELCEISRVVETEVVLLPEQAATIDLFEGVEPAGIASMVAESLGAATGDRGQRLLDRRILDAAIRSLKPPITPARLTAALGLFLRGARTPEVAVLIDDEEFDALDRAFADEQRTALLERLTVLEATLEPLAHFGTSSVGRRPLFADGSQGGLHCAALTGTDAEVVNELLVDLLVQSFIRRVTIHARSHGVDGHTSAEAVTRDRGPAGFAAHATGSGDMCAIVLGAERIVPSHLDKLNSLSVAHGFGLVLFFAALTEEIAETAVQNSDVLGIMRLTNHSQAERAASLIGSEYKMIFSAQALSESRSQTLNWGWSSGQSSSAMMPFNATTSEQQSRGGGRQDTTGNQDTYSRVHELVVEPESIQRLGSTAIEFVDLVDRANRAPISLDVHPLRALGR